MPVNQYSIDLNEKLLFPDSRALLKSSETLTFLVRDAAHVTPHNFESCVHCIRTFVEAGVNGGMPCYYFKLTVSGFPSDLLVCFSLCEDCVTVSFINNNKKKLPLLHCIIAGVCRESL